MNNLLNPLPGLRKLGLQLVKSAVMMLVFLVRGHKNTAGVGLIEASDVG